MRSTSRRGQGSGTATAAFVALVTLFIIIWILFLPPEERDRVLNNRTPGWENATPENVLLHEFPKTLFVEKQDEFDHHIDSINLYTSEEDQVLKRRDAVQIEKQAGSEGAFLIPFHLDDPAKVRNAKLAFTVESHSGSLIIILNGQVIFSGEITQVAPSPIELDNLEEDNILEFRVSDAGWQFWKVNSYQLRDVRILATVVDDKNRQATTQFSVTYNPQIVEDARLSFVTDCQQEQVGRLTATINDRVIISKTPQCGSPEITDFDPAILFKGTNILDFKSEKGALIIDNILVRTKVEEPTFPIYYFELNKTQFREVEEDDKDVTLTMKFAGDKTKRGTININNRKLAFNQLQNGYAKDISQYVLQDNNFIQIIPEQTLEVQEILVRVE